MVSAGVARTNISKGMNGKYCPAPEFLRVDMFGLEESIERTFRTKVFQYY